MSKADPSDKWKKEVELLRLKINDYENIIAKLQSEDSNADSKLENLNKLHAQKIRALMQSIQELKKQNAMIRAQNKENNRSKLIEKLKTELVQQEIAISALRDLVNDNDKCDDQIINYLNKGPPRIRPMSREEMKIQIRKLQSKLGITKTPKGDQAVNDLESLLNPSHSSTEEQKLVDPLQNEKIVELVEQIQNLQLDIRAKDSTIEHFRAQNKKMQAELNEYKNSENTAKFLDFKVSGVTDEKQSLIEKMGQNSSNLGELQAQFENLMIDYKAKLEVITSLKKRIEDLSGSQGGKNKEFEKTRKELSQAMNAIKNLETENKVLKDSKAKLLQELQDKENVLEDHKTMLETQKFTKSEPAESVADYKDLEIEALQAKLAEIQKNNNLPDSFLAAEKAETDKYREKVKELYHQVAELQEEVEYLHQDNVNNKKIGAAKALSGKVSTVEEQPNISNQQYDKLNSEYNKVLNEKNALKKELNQVKLEIRSIEEEKEEIKQKFLKKEEELQELTQAIKEAEFHKREILSRNRETVENIMANYSKGIPDFKVTVPRDINIPDLLKISQNFTNRFVTK